MKKILITGVAGFIGSNLCSTLLNMPNNQYSVIGIDNFDDYYSNAIKEINIAEFINNQNFKFIKLDITKNLQILNSEKVDTVVHLAGKVGVSQSIYDISSYLNSNIIGTNNILSLMQQIKCNRIIFASSSSVYGDADILPFYEEQPLGHSLSPYAMSKIACENLLYNYYHLFNINTIILRLFSVYGKNQRPDLAFSKFLNRIIQNRTIEIFGDGSSSRDYTEIYDVINAIILSINYLDDIKKNTIFSTMNIGSANPITTNQVIKNLYLLSEKKPNISYLGSNKEEMHRTFANISKANMILGYKPSISFTVGLKQFYQWFITNNKEEIC